MALSLGRRLYNFSNRHDTSRTMAWGTRPDGQLVWLHAPGPTPLAGLIELARRLHIEQGITVLLTSATPPEGNCPYLIHSLPPVDSLQGVQSFLNHWKPGLVLVTDGEIRPVLFSEASARGLPLIMAEARIPYLTLGREGWFPGLMREALQAVRQIHALDNSAARSFRNAGAISVKSSGRMEERSTALPCHEGERMALTDLITTRPVWLAAAVPEAEEEAVIAAHRSALRLAHRLLLILAPEDPSRADILTQKMEETEGWTVARRGLEQEPLPDTEVYIPDSASEYGLWYRLAPITFLGGSLFGEGSARNPLEPAALGSAIVHGPRPGRFGAALDRLGAARASRAVTTSTELADALSDLQAADRTARLAHAAWAVASDGVEVTEEILALVRNLIGVET